MDPDATYALLLDEDNDLDERAVAAVDLLVWMAGGGFTPRGRGRRTVIAECKHRIFGALDRLAELEEK